MKPLIYIINGPNLNMLGIREPDVYGSESYSDLVKLLEQKSKELNIDIEVFQSNHEGALVDKIQEAYFRGATGIVINPAAYTHTSIALLDALKSVNLPAVEVHISNVDEREAYRKISYVSEFCELRISGHGFYGYIEALEHLVSVDNNYQKGNTK